MAESRKPDYNLSAMDEDNVCKGKVGAAWTNDDGSINIKLNPFVVLDAMDGLKIRLFPFREWPEVGPKGKTERASTPPDLEDDTPF